MAYTPAELAAIERMRQTRPADFDNDGHELAFPNRLNDTAAALAGAGREIAQAGSDAQAAASSAQAAAADRAQTGKDATATAADRTQTGKDAQATAADRTRTGEDRTAIEAVGRTVAAAALSADDDAKATAADRAAVEAVGRAATASASAADEDARAAAQDRIATGDDRRAAAASALEAAKFDPAGFYTRGQSDERFAPLLSGLGYNQSWQSVTRDVGVRYQNTTGKPIMLSLYFSSGSGMVFVRVSPTTTLGAAVARLGQLNNSLTIIVPPGYYYSFDIGSGSPSSFSATELR